MATEEESPLIKALPPASDYLTYLTIIEYNLTPENLPILHKVLQDEKLATNIGWDLVHLLIPHLPESEQCLDDVARFGNPREVILKVTESLRLIDYDGLEDDEGDDGPAGDGDDDMKAKADSSTYPLRTKAVNDGGARSGSTQAFELPPPLPLPVNQFVSLLSMLSVLQQRIKTKYPSRFLSTTLQAILASFGNASACRDEMIEAIVKLVKTTTGIKRPTLPARRSSGMIQTSRAVSTDRAADPEGSNVEVSPEEVAMQTKLLQSFVTHLTEEYLLNFPPYDDVPGMAWCSRFMEKTHPERNIPEGTRFGRRFATEERLQRRIDSIGQLVNLAQDLKLRDEQLLDAAITAEKVADLSQDDEDEPPKSAEDIPLSRLGSLLLYAARQVSSVLYDRPQSTTTALEIFPGHQELLNNCLAAHGMGTGQLGTEPEALIDSVLALGIICLERDGIGRPSTDEQFNNYLQTTALLSSNCPNSNLRGHAHYLTSTILRSQPDEEVRLAFIRDTLEHCPFENLKVSAVGWIKGETIEANPPTPAPWFADETATASSPTEMEGREHHSPGESVPSPSIFAKPWALDGLAPYLFPSVRADLVAAPVEDAWMTFQTNVSFYLASLNFLYLLLRAKHVHHSLEIHDLWNNHDITGSFLQPLREARARFLWEMEDGGAVASEKSDSALAELTLLEETVEMVTKAVPNLNES